MTSVQKVFLFSLAMILCLSLSAVTAAANDVDEAKAALIEYLLPELVNSPEYQAILKRTEKRGRTGFATLDLLDRAIPNPGAKRASFPAYYSLEKDLKIPGRK